MRWLAFFLWVSLSCHATRITEVDPRLAAEVRDRIESMRRDLPPVHVLSAPRTSDGAFAVCYDDRIVLGRDALADRRFWVAHELVHWFIDASPLAGLPHFVEEGVADWISCELTGLLTARFAEADRIGRLRVPREHLALSAREAGSLPLADRETLDRAGFDIVRRLGLERLHELAARGAAPDAYLFAAGIE